MRAGPVDVLQLRLFHKAVPVRVFKNTGVKGLGRLAVALVRIAGGKGAAAVLDPLGKRVVNGNVQLVVCNHIVLDVFPAVDALAELKLDFLEKRILDFQGFPGYEFGPKLVGDDAHHHGPLALQAVEPFPQAPFFIPYAVLSYFLYLLCQVAKVCSLLLCQHLHLSPSSGGCPK